MLTCLSDGASRYPLRAPSCADSSSSWGKVNCRQRRVASVPIRASASSETTDCSWAVVRCLRAMGDARSLRSWLRPSEELIEVELTAKVGAEPGERNPVPPQPAQRPPPQAALDPGGRCRGRDKAAQGQLLPRAARASPSHRQGPVGGDHACLHHRDYLEGGR